MKISEISVRRPVFATVLSLFLVLIGLASAMNLAVREYPDIDPPIVSIETTYRGASAEVIETRVTQVIEDQVAGLEGIVKLTSSSRDERSSVTIEFSLNRNVDEAANDVRDRVGRVIGALPAEADPPQIAKADGDTDPVMWLTLTSDRHDTLELTDIAERMVVDRLSVVEGVARVRLGGARRYAMRIWLDREAMAARGITADDITAALRRENVELPAGRLESTQREFTLRTRTGLTRPDDFSALVIQRSSDGNFVRLGDVAQVRLGAEDERSIARANSVPAIGMGIEQQSKGNTVEVSRGVRAAMEEMGPSLPEGVVIGINFDRAAFIQASMLEVIKALGFALTPGAGGHLPVPRQHPRHAGAGGDHSHLHHRHLLGDGAVRLLHQRAHPAGPGARHRAGGGRRHRGAREHLATRRGRRTAAAGRGRGQPRDRFRGHRHDAGAGVGVPADLLHPGQHRAAVPRVRRGRRGGRRHFQPGRAHAHPDAELEAVQAQREAQLADAEGRDRLQVDRLPLPPHAGRDRAASLGRDCAGAAGDGGGRRAVPRPAGRVRAARGSRQLPRAAHGAAGRQPRVHGGLLPAHGSRADALRGKRRSAPRAVARARRLGRRRRRGQRARHRAAGRLGQRSRSVHEIADEVRNELSTCLACRCVWSRPAGWACAARTGRCGWCWAAPSTPSWRRGATS
jgi:hypothetical protein